VVAQKGGVAKTTTVENLAAAWGAAGRRVLAIDCDEQFDLTRAFGVAPSQAPGTVLDVISGRCSVADALVRDVLPGVDLLAAHRDLRGLEIGLAGEDMREKRLAMALRDVTGYDELLIDCQAKLGLITTNALCAVSEVIVVISLRDARALQSAAEVQRTVSRLASLDVDIAITAAVRTMVRHRRQAYQAISTSLAEMGLPLTTTEIPMTADFENATVMGQQLVISDPRSAGAAAYVQLARELTAAPIARAA
jgi:chromosome partitioning protein